ncbi:MAG: S1 RNA-binding domain-containing protein [Clostridia bacterium]|nr:S1 RNA-binding domain-containing protein [Clostridia bacterium]
MQIEVGSILEGKVTGIVKFGAFVDLPEGKSGMVHISEISNTYVENVTDFLAEGQTVKVKVLAINENGKISLSIKKACENGEQTQSEKKKANHGGNFRKNDREGGKDKRDNKQEKRPYNNNSNSRQPAKSANSPGDYVWKKSENPTSFEDMMSKFKQTSDEKMSSLKRNNENVVRRPRRKG